MPSQHIRKSFFSLLNGSISYNGNAIPVYENSGDSTAPVQIIIAEYADGNASTKHYFGSSARQVIEVVSQQPDGFRKIVDDVASLVFQIVQPSVISETLSNTEFQVHFIGKPDISYLTEQGEPGQAIVRLLLGYNLRIIER